MSAEPGDSFQWEPSCVLCGSKGLGRRTESVDSELSPDWSWTNGPDELEIGDGTRAHDPLKAPWNFVELLPGMRLEKEQERLFKEATKRWLSNAPCEAGETPTPPVLHPHILAFYHDRRKQDNWIHSLAHVRPVPYPPFDPNAIERERIDLMPLIQRPEGEYGPAFQTEWMKAAEMDSCDLGVERRRSPSVVMWTTKNDTHIPDENRPIFVHWDCMQVLVTQLVGKRIDAKLTAEDWLSLNHEALGVAMYSFSNDEDNEIDKLAPQRRVLHRMYSAPNPAKPVIPLVKAGVLQSSLSRLLFKSNRFQQALETEDLQWQKGQDEPIASPDNLLAKLPGELLSLVLRYLDADDLRSVSRTSKTMRIALQSDEFWLSWLRAGAYDRVLPELKDALMEGIAMCKRENKPLPKWRQVAGWLEVVSTPTNLSAGWSTVLESRLRILKMADIVLQRYHQVQTHARWALDDPEYTFCLAPTKLMLHGVVSKADDLQWKTMCNAKSLPFISLRMTPGPRGSAVRLAYEAEKPVIQLFDEYDDTEQNILPFGDLVVLIEFGLSPTVAPRTSGLVQVRLVTSKGTKLSLKMPGFEDAPVEYVIYSHAPRGFLFLDQIYASKSFTKPRAFHGLWANPLPDPSKHHAFAFRGITQGPFNDSDVRRGNYFNRVIWTVNDDSDRLQEIVNKNDTVIRPDNFVGIQDKPMNAVFFKSQDELTDTPQIWLIYRDGSANMEYRRTLPIRGIKRPGQPVVGITTKEAKKWPKKNIQKIEISRKSNLVAVMKLDYLEDIIPSHKFKHNEQDWKCSIPLFKSGMFRGIVWNEDNTSLMLWRPNSFTGRKDGEGDYCYCRSFWCYCCGDYGDSDEDVVGDGREVDFDDIYASDDDPSYDYPVEYYDEEGYDSDMLYHPGMAPRLDPFLAERWRQALEDSSNDDGDDDDEEFSD